MAKPTPDQITATNINQQFAKSLPSYSSTSQVSYGNNWTKNVASIGIDLTQVTAQQISYGVNIPLAVTLGDDAVPQSNVKVSNSAYLWGDVVQLTNGGASARANLILRSDGTGSYIRDQGTQTGTNRTGVTAVTDDFTWRPSSDTTSGNYYVQFFLRSNNKTAVAFGADSSAVNTDLVLSTTRAWSFLISDVTAAGNQKIVRGDIIMKYSTDGGSTKEEYFRRPITFDVTATGSFN